MTLHWTRAGLLAGAGLTAVGTCMPWLVGVPDGVLKIGSGTILGITTVHGAVVLVLMIAVGALALRSERDRPPRRLALAGVLPLALVALVTSSLVLGTSKTEIYEEIERVLPPDLASAAIVQAANRLRDFDMGVGAYPVVFGLGLLVLAAIAGMFARRRPAVTSSRDPLVAAAAVV